MRSSTIYTAVLLLVAALHPASLWSQEVPREALEAVTVEPAAVLVDGPEAVRGLLVHGQRKDRRVVDLTHVAEYRSSTTDLFTVDPRGVVTAIADGAGAVEVVIAGRTISVPVQIQGTRIPRHDHFENDIIPILSKHSCNASGCHGKAEGKNGFKLSVFGFNPTADYDAITKEGRGRRAFPGAAERRLILTKASGGVPHGGGIRFYPDSREYNTLREWIASGVPVGDPAAPIIHRIEILPAERIMDTGAGQQLRVLAFYSDGREVDVTQIAKYQSNNDGLASVDEEGQVQIGKVPGQVAVMATYMGAVDTFQALIPRKQRIQPEHYPELAEKNFIDRLVHVRLKNLHIIPSAASDDAEFLRRAFLSIIGTLPTADEVRQFLDDSSAEKRARLVDDLLERPEYADFWALKWSDLLRVDRKKLGHRGAHEYYAWIHRSVDENKTLD